MKPDLPWSATDEKKGIQRGLLWIALSTTVILFIIVITAWSASEQNMRIWANANWIQLGLGWCLMCSALWALGHRWKALLPSPQPSGAELGAALCGALLLNYAIPGPFGEIAAAHHIHKRHKIPFARTLASGSVARLAGLFTAAVGALGLSAISGIALSADHRWALWVCLAGITTGSLALGALFLFPARWTVERHSSQALTVASKLKRFLSDLAEAITNAIATADVSQRFHWSGVSRTNP